MSMPNFPHASFRGFTRRMSFAAIAAGFLSSFANCILHIVTAGSDEKMIRSYARRVIAVMANLKSFRDWAEMYLPRCTMGRNVFPVPIIPDLSVFIRRSPGPNPASFSFLNELPKPAFNRHGLFRHCLVAELGTKLRSRSSIRG
jgi:hypothetical protein